MAVRLQITGPEFLAFCTALGHEREAAGAGPGARIGIGQRADALAVVAALNDCDGWLDRRSPPGTETAESVFARHLAPILCETPAMQAALQRVLARDRVPGAFVPPLPHLAPPEPDRQPEPPPDPLLVYRAVLGAEFRWRWLRLREVLLSRPGRLTMGLGVLTIALAIAFPAVQRSLVALCAADSALSSPLSSLRAGVCTLAGPLEGDPTQDNVLALGGGASQGSDVRPVTPGATPEEAPLGPLHRMLSILDRTGFDRSPAHLAEHLAATAQQRLDPALYLEAMLTRWPMPADRPIPRDRIGALAVVNFAIAVAELEGDTGAVAAIRGRLRGLTAVSPTGWVSLSDGTVLPDAPQTEAEAGLSLQVLGSIDPRLARFAVDDVVLEVWSRAPPDILNAQPPQQVQQQPVPQVPLDPGTVDLRQTAIGDRLATFANDLTDRFGVPPGFDPAGTDPVTLNGIVAAIRTALEAEAPLDTSFRTALVPWHRAVDLVVLLPPVAALVWAVLGFGPALRRRLARWPRVPPPQVHLVVPAPDREPPALAMAARRLAPRLRYTMPRITDTLDVEASLARTLKEGSYFTPVLRRRRDIASHVVLIHRRTLAEHEPRRIASLFGQLQAAGVSLALFEYAADPTRVRPFGQTGSGMRDLNSLFEHYPEARLIVVTTGDEFTGAGAYGASAGSVRALRHWPQRAIVTPVPVGNWGVREWALSVQLGAPLARAAPDGVSDLAAIFPADPGGAPAIASATLPRPDPGSAAEWLRKVRAADRPDDSIPALPRILAISEAEAALPRGASPDRLEALLTGLRRWLSPQGYLWLQACASYPVLRYPLTRWLGDRLFGQAVPLRSLAQLSQLGWFAVGRMPAALAARLRRDLSEADAARIEALFSEFFARHVVEGPSPAQDAGRSYGGDRIAYEPDPLGGTIPGARQLPAGLAADPAAEQARLRQVRLAVLLDRTAVLLAAVFLAVGLRAVWPDRTALPLPPGAWLPVVGVAALWAVLGALTVVALSALRRSRPAVRRAPSRPDLKVAA